MPVPGPARRMPLARTLASVAVSGLLAAGLSVPATADVTPDEVSDPPTDSGADLSPAVAEVDGVDLVEIHYAEDDEADFIEISADPGTDISGWVAGSITRGDAPHTSDHVVTLDEGTQIPETGHYAIEVPITNSTDDGYGSSAFVTTSFEPGGEIVGFWTIGERDGGEGTTAGDSALLPEVIRGETASPTGLTGSSSESLQWVDGEWIAASPTPGEPNDDESDDPGDPGEPQQLEIAEVWDVADETPVTTTGVVTAHYPEGGFDGYTIQTAGSGADGPSEQGNSHGIFVYSPDTVEDVEIGQLVEVTGERGEYQGLHQISVNAGGVAVLEDDASDPATPIEDFMLPATEEDRLAVQSMLVHPADRYVVSDTYALGGFGDTRFGTIGLGLDAPLVQETELINPAQDPDGYAELVAVNEARAISLDDGQSERTDFDAEVPYLTGEENVRTGVGLTFEQPVVVDYRFQWNFQPTQPVTGNAEDLVSFDGGDTREANSAPADVGGDVQVAIFNVLNYFTTLGADQNACTHFDDREGNPLTVADCVDPNPGPRGAWDSGVLQWQQDKIVVAINDLDADVVALSEIENSAHFNADGDRDESLEILVDALNDAAGEDRWAHAASPEEVPDLAHDDVIRNAFIYQPETVELAGDAQILTGQSAEGEAFDNAREPLAQPFGVVGSDYEFLAVANHFKSKGGDCGDPEPAEGCFNDDRVEQANSLMTFADEVATEAGIDDVLLMGDFNSYSAEDPVRAFEDAGYVNANPAWNPENEFTGDNTYVFDGQVGSLDHIFLSEEVGERHTGTETWSINANESVLAEYSRHNYFASVHFTERAPFRSSDHDPVVIGLDVPEQGPGDPDDPGQVDLRVLSFNDFHGRIGSDEDNLGDDSVAVGMACYIDQQRQDYENTLLVSGGDNIGGTTFTSFIADDEPTLDVLNELDLDVSVLGNHEFDQGQEDVNDRVIPYTENEFPWIAANIVDDAGEPVYQPYEIVEAGGVNVAFVGAITQDMPTLVSPAGIEGLNFTSISETVNDYAAELTGSGEADVVIAVVHEGLSSASDPASGRGTLGELIDDPHESIAGIVSGHTHMQYTHQVGDTWVTQAGQYGEAIVGLDLTIDTETGEVVTSQAELVEIEPASAQECAAGEDMMQIVEDARANAEELGGEVIGEATHDFNRAQNQDGEENRGGESVLGAMVADAHLWAAQRTSPETQIAFMNSGGLRADLAAGPVTVRDAGDIQPFANSLTTMELTGAQLAQVLEEQWSPDRDFLKLAHSSAFRYIYDPEAQPGDRITEMFLDDEPIQPDEHYSVVMNDFIASGGDGFATFAEGRNSADAGQVDLDATVEYIRDQEVITPDFTQRALGVTWVSDPEAVHSPGDEIALDVSSFTFTAGEPVPEVLSSNLGGVSTGEFDLDATPVEGTDESGRAEIRAQVPEVLTITSSSAGGIGTMAAGGAAASEPAVYALEIVDETNGTVLTIPITVDAGDGPGDGSAGPGLPETGADIGWLAAGALVLLLLGGLLLTLRRVRSGASSAAGGSEG